MRNGGKVFLLILISVITVSSVYADELLTLEDAIKIGLKNNYDIQIARNSARISLNNRGLGTAGFLPTLDLSGNYQLSQTDEESNSATSFGNTDTENWGGSISLNWTLFDGFKMFIEKKRYNALARLGEYRARDIIENNVVAISRAYFNLVQQEQLLDVARDAKDISAQRLEKARIRKELGGASSTDFLNAQVAYNSDESALLNQQLQVTIAAERLNLIMGQSPDKPLEVSKEISVPELELTLDEILERAFEKNSGLKVARQNRLAADAGARSSFSPFLPKLSLNASYGYSDRTVSGDAIGFGNDIYTERTDAAVGLMLSFNLFNGGRNRIEWQNARLEAKNQRLALEDAQNQLTGAVQQAYDTYINQIQLVELEQQNLLAAEQNLQLHQDRFQTGALSSLEFRDAQVSLIRAQTALIVARYQARITRLEIEQLTGNLKVEL